MKVYSECESSTDEGRTGRWTLKEHEDFMRGVSFYGKDWKKIADFLGTRTPVQVRSHAQKFYLREETVKKSKRKSHKAFKFQPISIEVYAKKDKSTQYGEGVLFPGTEENQNISKMYFLY
ncbi:unnamed protein product [Blepharisma stoltei]|uniref:Uncharacterized protein n=1 Tax=Blepharisma stoltei TaxID=1481888 RepID=A0AAU9JW05_9CILI|nr:unnamed protein product [Blepharisma stoltei]